jgi:hypothetical protein
LFFLRLARFCKSFPQILWLAMAAAPLPPGAAVMSTLASAAFAT